MIHLNKKIKELRKPTLNTRFAWFATFWFVPTSVDLPLSVTCFWVNSRFFLTLTQRTTTVWSSLLLWCRVPPITKSTRKWWPLERRERDPVYPEPNPYSWLQPSPAPGPSDMPSTHSLAPAHIHTITDTHLLAPLTQDEPIHTIYACHTCKVTTK